MSMARPDWLDWVDEKKYDEMPFGSRPIFKKGTPKSVIEEYEKEVRETEELAKKGIIR